MQQILIIEDDAVMRDELANLLQNSGYQPLIPAALEPSAAINMAPDLILLDINLPTLNGKQFLRQLREQSNVPVIMVTSSNSEADEMLSMSYGADDYVTKPYNPNILLLRIAAVLKRSESASTIQKFRGLNIDLNRGVIEANPSTNTSERSRRVLLTKNEMIILGHLLNRQGQIVPRDALMTDLWNNHEYINDNALTVNVSRLRAKLKLLGADEAIETRKGLGYILV